jgi:hypothetical protein
LTAVNAQRLRKVTDELLKRTNRQRPVYLENIVAPPHAPAAAGP